MAAAVVDEFGALLPRLGLLDGDRREHDTDRTALDRLRRGEQGFHLVHLGLRDVSLGQLEDCIHGDPALLPPRTAHLGNWSNIALGRSGLQDYNKTICVDRALGYPLVFDFNQTETVDLNAGDFVYLPGSLVDGDRRQLLPVLTWDGRHFAARDRNKPYFCPFVHTSLEGERVPLPEAHWRRMRRLAGFEFRGNSSYYVDQERLVRPLVTALVQHACNQRDPERGLAEVIDRTVRLDATVQRISPRIQGRDLHLGDQRYGSTAALVDAVMLPYLAAARPREFWGSPRDLPREMPLLSNSVTTAFFPLLATHRPNGSEGEWPFVTHLHWGGPAMAGFPPKRRGYLAKRKMIRRLERMLLRMLDAGAVAVPVCFVLAPAAPYALCPASAHPDDAELVGALIRNLQQATARVDPDGSAQARAIDATVSDWLDAHKSKLSRYFLNRFAQSRGVLSIPDANFAARSLEPAGFREMTIRQACAVVGALVEQIGGTPMIA